MPSKPRKSKKTEPTLAQLQKRLARAEGKIACLTDRANHSAKFIGEIVKDITDELLDDHKRLTEIEQKRLPGLKQDLEKHSAIDQKFFYAVDTQLAAFRQQRAGIFKILRGFKRWMTDLGEQQSRMDLEIAKGTDAYYHLYPERLEPDTKFTEQFTKLFPPPRKPHSRKKPS